MIDLKKNAVLSGVILGLVIPFVGVAVLMMLDEWIVDLVNSPVYNGQKQRTLFLLGICLNLIPFQYFRNQRRTQSMRGVGIMTMIYAAAWFVYFASEFL
jgi:hypothetical protein